MFALNLWETALLLLSAIFFLNLLWNEDLYLKTEYGLESVIFNKPSLSPKDKPGHSGQLSNTDRMPVIVRWNSLGFDNPPSVISCGDVKCKLHMYPDRVPIDRPGAYQFHVLSLNFNDLPLPRYPHRVLWGITLLESSINAWLLQETVLKLFNYSSSFSRYSDVPIYRHLPSLDDVTSRKYFISTSKKNSLLRDLAPIMFLQSNCVSISQRRMYVRELMKYQKIDSYGPCLNNKKLPSELEKDYLSNLQSPSFLKFIARYKFVIAIENAVCEDYVTEKFWRPITVGVVPIYFGCPKIREWFPNQKSAILVQDFPTPELMSEHINKLLADDELYEEYLEHKTKTKISYAYLVDILKQGLDKRDYTRDLTCLMCEKLHKEDELKKHRFINQSHYNCSPISALSQDYDFTNVYARLKFEQIDAAEKLYHEISTKS